MTTSIPNLFNPAVGIQDLLEMPESPALPSAHKLPSSVLRQSGLESLYSMATTRTLAESLLCPDIGDGRIVTPDVFEANLRALLEKLKKSENPAVQALLKEEILPILENGLLLSAYRNLMLGG